MILVDTALRQRESEGRPVRVGMYGAGAMARGFVAQVSALVPGMEVVAIANRTLQRAADAYGFAGRDGRRGGEQPGGAGPGDRSRHAGDHRRPQPAGALGSDRLPVDMTGRSTTALPGPSRRSARASRWC